MPMKMQARAPRDPHVSSQEERRGGHGTGEGQEGERDEWKREERRMGGSIGGREKHIMS